MRKPPGWWYPWIFVTGMLVVIAANVVMIAYAIGTFPGLDTEDAYRQGLAYNRTLAAARVQEQQGWQADIRFIAQSAPAVKAGAAQGELVVRFVDHRDQPLRGLAVTAMLVRPTRTGIDQRVALDERGNGTYGAALALPAAGQWDARIMARRGDADFQATQRIVVP